MSNFRTGKLIAVLAGKVREHPPHAEDPAFNRPWRSAFIKEPISGPAKILQLGLELDEVANKDVHGGLDQSVLAYPFSHYQLWQQELGIKEMGPGGFGENLCIHGFNEQMVCIGDSFKVGQAVLQVSLPRLPCSSIDRRWLRSGLVKRVAETQRTGWYFRVLEEGSCRASDQVALIERKHPQWTVARVLELRLKGKQLQGKEASNLARCQELAAHWRHHFEQHREDTRIGL
tara:strand:- start:34 stop:726 length:693 start_codon:yes stop_codon:yes gene_type:complete